MDFEWDWAYMAGFLPDLVRGAWVIVKATLGGFAIAVSFGLALALMRRSSKRWLSWPAAGFIEFIRSTPILIQLFFVVYALPTVEWLPRDLRLFSPFLSLVIVLGVHYATYASEAYRAGINSVPKGQWEASVATNLSTVDTWRHVILPQAIPRTLPALGNYASAMLKDAPNGSAVGVLGLLFVAKNIGGQTFRYVEPMLTAGVLFLAISIPTAMAVRVLERKLGYES